MGQTLGRLCMNPVYIHTFPLPDHVELPSCWCGLCSPEYPVTNYVGASVHTYLVCIDTQLQYLSVCAHLPGIQSQLHYWLGLKPGTGTVLPLSDEWFQPQQLKALKMNNIVEGTPPWCKVSLFKTGLKTTHNLQTQIKVKQNT